MRKRKSCFQDKKIGILGGTFDPVHTGHVMLAEAAYQSFGLDQVVFMPNGNPPHKKTQDCADTELRMDMIEAAIAGKPYFSLSRHEIDAEAYHYTFETLRELKEENPNTEYYFIMGADSLFDLQDWREPQVICDSCTILAATRDHKYTGEMLQQMEKLKGQFGAKIHLLPTPNIDISSREIRIRIMEGKSIAGFVPPGVDAYIRSHGLYRREEERA